MTHGFLPPAESLTPVYARTGRAYLDAGIAGVGVILVLSVLFLFLLGTFRGILANPGARTMNQPTHSR